ncbi:MAG: hypothetical protein ACW98D_14480 [Promethearchaeota archaeon]|jgi:hypothetical protein
MNEFTILMHLLSKTSDSFEMGATKEDILKKLNLHNKNESVYFQNLIVQLSNYLGPLGLQIRFNPLSSRWYMAFEMATSDLVYANPFEDKPRLAATLFCVLICCLKNTGIGKIHDIEKLRKKKTVIDDLKELRNRGYIKIDDDLGQVVLTPLIGYQLDLNKLFIKLTLKLTQK